MNQKIADNFFPSLTGVRAVAAYMVFMHHFNPVRKQVYGKSFYNFVQEFHVGVALFFVLSGFLIAYRYLDSELFNFKNYLVNRIARIYPMYFLLTTLTFLYAALFVGENNLHALRFYILNITFLRGFSSSLLFSGVAQGWSLSVEATFYLLAPLIFILLRRNKINLITIPCFLILSGLLLVHFFRDYKFYGFFQSNEFMLNYTFFGRCFEFFIGIGLAMYYKRNANHRRTKYHTYLGLIVIIISINAISMIKGDFDLGIRHPIGKALNTFIMPLFGISVFYYGLLTEKTFISKVLGSKLFVLLGRSSYIFYLIHVGIFLVFLNKFTTNNLILFVAFNIISVILFKLIEEPMNQMIRKKLKKINHTVNPSIIKENPDKVSS